MSPAPAAGLIDPFGKYTDTPDPEEWTLLKQALRKALDEYQVGKVVTWQAPGGGLSGEVKILRVFTKSGMRCAEATHVYTKGDEHRTTLPFCQVADGTWKIAL
jgi:surface antigen